MYLHFLIEVITLTFERQVRVNEILNILKSSLILNFLHVSLNINISKHRLDMNGISVRSEPIVTNAIRLAILDKSFLED